MCGGQGGCERRIEVFVKIQKKLLFFWGGGGVRVDVNEELKFLRKFTKKNSGGGGGGSGWWGVRVDVNAMLGVGGDVGYGGCEPRIEGIVQCTKRYCTILRKWKNVGGGGAIFEPKTLSMYSKKKKKKVQYSNSIYSKKII